MYVCEGGVVLLTLQFMVLYLNVILRVRQTALRSENSHRLEAADDSLQQTRLKPLID